MRITDLRVEYRKNPLGLDTAKPRFSWKIESEQTDTMQTAYQIQVISEGRMIWDPGRCRSDESVLVEYAGAALAAECLYEYRAVVWDNHGEMAEAVGTFETGLLAGTNFKAKWVTHPFSAEETACPVFVKEIALEKKVKRARIYATALGVYEIRLDGKKVGNAFFAPGWTNYKKRLQYQTYDATELFGEKDSGKHVLEITVGNGWYKGILGFTCTPCNYGDKAALLAQLHVTYDDGTEEVFATGDDWRVKTGPVRYSELYMGETIDSTWKSEDAAAVEPFSYPMEQIVS